MGEGLLESLLTGPRGMEITPGSANMAQSWSPRRCPIVYCLDMT